MTDAQGSARWSRVNDVFHRALDEPDVSRAAFVRRECGERSPASRRGDVAARRARPRRRFHRTAAGGDDRFVRQQVGPRRDHRPDRRSLPDRASHRPRRDGRRLPRRRHPARPGGRAQSAGAELHRRSDAARALAPRSAGRGGIASQRHRHGVRAGGDRRSALHRRRVRAGRDAARRGRARAAAVAPRARNGARDCARPSRRRTSAA